MPRMNLGAHVGLTYTRQRPRAPSEDDVEEGQDVRGLVVLVAGRPAHEAHAEASLWWNAMWCGLWF